MELNVSEEITCKWQNHSFVTNKYASRALYLRTFALIVFAHPYCARNSLRDVMPRHALSVCTVEEMWSYIALVGTLISMHGCNSLKCSGTPYFLLIDHFLCRLSTFCEKTKEICVVEVWLFSTVLPSHHRILLLLKLHGVRKSPS